MKRTEIPSFKGYELYSWLNEQGNFSYALLPGTNRNKTGAEIMNAGDGCRFDDLAGLKIKLETLAERDQVSWLGGSLDHQKFILPPADVVADLQEQMKKLKIEFIIALNL